MPDSVAENIPLTSEQQIAELVDKHRPEIDRIKVMESKGQMEAFRELGVDPNAVMGFYKDLYDRDAELSRQNDAAIRKTNVLSVASIAGSATVTFVIKEKISKSPIVQFFAVPLTGMLFGLAATFAGSKIFGGKVRKKSMQLDIDARNALERELAVALENREREGMAAARPSAASRDIAPRDPAYAAQAKTEKAATAGVAQVR